MTSTGRSQDDALRGFRGASESSNTPLSNLKKYVGWKNREEQLPYAFKDAQHSATSPPGSNGTTPSGNSAFLSWPAWASAEAPWYETLGLSRTQRYVACGIFWLGAAALFLMAFMFMPIALISPGKFVIPYCFGSLLIFVSLGFLQGFGSYFRHLFSRDRWIFSVSFLGTTLATLLVALFVRSYLLTIPLAIIQFIVMIAFIISYLPGGATGVSALTSMARSRVGL